MSDFEEDCDPAESDLDAPKKPSAPASPEQPSDGAASSKSAPEARLGGAKKKDIRKQFLEDVDKIISHTLQLPKKANLTAKKTPKRRGNDANAVGRYLLLPELQEGFGNLDVSEDVDALFLEDQRPSSSPLLMSASRRYKTPKRPASRVNRRRRPNSTRRRLGASVQQAVEKAKKRTEAYKSVVVRRKEGPTELRLREKVGAVGPRRVHSARRLAATKTTGPEDDRDDEARPSGADQEAQTYYQRHMDSLYASFVRLEAAREESQDVRHKIFMHRQMRMRKLRNGQLSDVFGQEAVREANTRIAQIRETYGPPRRGTPSLSQVEDLTRAVEASIPAAESTQDWQQRDLDWSLSPSVLHLIRCLYSSLGRWDTKEVNGTFYRARKLLHTMQSELSAPRTWQEDWHSNHQECNPANFVAVVRQLHDLVLARDSLREILDILRVRDAHAGRKGEIPTEGGQDSLEESHKEISVLLSEQLRTLIPRWRNTLPWPAGPFIWGQPIDEGRAEGAP